MSLSRQEKSLLDSPLLAAPVWAHVTDEGKVTWSPEAEISVRRGALFRLAPLVPAKKLEIDGFEHVVPPPPRGVYPDLQTWPVVERVLYEIAAYFGYQDYQRYLAAAWREGEKLRLKVRADLAVNETQPQ